MSVVKDSHKHKHYSEQFTIFLSVLCTIHCIITPILVVVLPVAGAYFEQYHWVEYVIIASVFLFGTSSILHGYKHHHHNKIPAFIFFSGLVLLCAATLLKLAFHVGDFQTHLISGIGGIAAGIGQLYNLKLSK
ncbi:MAG: MerC domain-containing protein [Chitinophagales bacterium]|nr:MerC domain-containing protein [Chitinophagales bacterium]HMV16026.1 MerC domain-containing protein [Chitinophagales bacterium]HMZ33614.1 MerC domain-containing protein [Chitinophagales bacterium]HNA39522.1 MerC domain-containing protein [Chitinophagales bacterium]HNB49232.1 MerC domain-containing protein [Chitinophagales bacterium]